MSADSEKIKTWVAYWRERGYERGETQSFWLSLLSQVLGVAEPERHINFEARVKLEHTNFIDAWLPETKVMIEQKGRG